MQVYQFYRYYKTKIRDNPSIEGADIYTTPQFRGQARNIWTPQEHLRFVEALEVFGPNWDLISDDLGSRTPAQVQEYYYQLQ